MENGGLNMKLKMKIKKYIGLPLLIVMMIGGIFTMNSCKRSKVEDPGTHKPSGFYISLSGTASPSTLYLPTVDSVVESTITVKALKNDGTPAAGYPVVFEAGSVGYFEGYRYSDERNTNINGTTQIRYYVSNVRGTLMNQITATLRDDRRLDNPALGSVVDYIPLKIIPAFPQGIVLSGEVRNPEGNGIEGVVILLEGADGNASGVTVTRPRGNYEFFVAAGWYGSITPDSPGYTFVPANYTFDSFNAVYFDMDNLDFIAYFESGNTLAADVTSWEVPAEGGTQKVNVFNATGDAAIDYTVAPSTPWIHVSPTSGTTPGSFTITVDENTTGADRNGTVIITATNVQGATVNINITQKGKEVSSDARLEVDRQTVTFTYVGGQESINTFNRNTSDSIDYIITPSETWITLSTSTGSTDDSFDIIVGANNTGEPRTGKVILTVTTTGVSNSQVEIIVNQEAGPAVAVSPDTYTAKAAGGESFTVYVYNKNTSDVLYWTAANLDSWIYFTPASGTTGNSFTVTIQNANPTSNPRQGVITITASNGTQATVIVTQEGS
jgi:hypothetical protein